MTNYQRTANWLAACGKFPLESTENNLSVQIGVHIEEFCEFLRSIKVDTHTSLNLALSDLERISDALKKGQASAYIPPEQRVNALDALCDCEVTGNGVAYLAGFNKDAADQEVLASNESKLVDGVPVILPGGKIGKGPNYKRPQLEGCV